MDHLQQCLTLGASSATMNGISSLEFSNGQGRLARLSCRSPNQQVAMRVPQ